MSGGNGDPPAFSWEALYASLAALWLLLWPGGRRPAPRRVVDTGPARIALEEALTVLRARLRDGPQPPEGDRQAFPDGEGGLADAGAR